MDDPPATTSSPLRRPHVQPQQTVRRRFLQLQPRQLFQQFLLLLDKKFRSVFFQFFQYGSVFFRKFVSFCKIIGNSALSGEFYQFLEHLRLFLLETTGPGQSSTLPAVSSRTASPPPAILSAISSASRAHTSRATSAPRTSPPAPAFSVLQSLGFFLPARHPHILRLRHVMCANPGTVTNPP